MAKLIDPVAISDTVGGGGELAYFVPKISGVNNMRPSAKPAAESPKPSNTKASSAPASKPRMPLQEALKRTNERFGML